MFPVRKDDPRFLQLYSINNVEAKAEERRSNTSSVLKIKLEKFNKKDPEY